MSKKSFAGLLLVALCIGVCGTATAETKWTTERLAIRTLSGATDPDGGRKDSLVASMGTAATTDTTVAFRYNVRPIPGVPDSAQYVIAHLTFHHALASGESVYVNVEGSLDNGANWRTLKIGTIPIGAPITSQVQAGNIIFSGKPNSATKVSMFSPGEGTAIAYGAWFGFPHLRFVVRTDGSGGMAASSSVEQRYEIWATYVTDK